MGKAATQEVQRPDARSVSAEQWSKCLDGRVPIILTHALETEESWDPAAWEERLFELHGSENVTYSERHSQLPPGYTNNREAPLHYAFQILKNHSCHDMAFGCMDENLLRGELG